MRSSAAERVREYGRARFGELVGRAVVILKEDGRLVGLDRLRLSLARAASEVAIGCSVRTYVPPKGLLVSGSVPDFCDELVSACALRLRLEGHVQG